MTDVTRLREAANRGDGQSAAELLPVVSEERRLFAAPHVVEIGGFGQLSRLCSRKWVITAPPIAFVRPAATADLTAPPKNGMNDRTSAA